MNTEYSSDDEKARKTYLIQFRNGLWTAIRHKESGTWQFISLYAAAIILIIGFLQGNTILNFNNQSIPIIISVIMLITIWGLVIILDANFWLQRNLWTISNIENEFLGNDRGIGSILPLYFTTPNFNYGSLYLAHLNFLFVFLLFFLISFYYFQLPIIQMTNFQQLVSIGIFLIIFSISSYSLMKRDNTWIKRYHGVRNDSKGDRKDFIAYKDFYTLSNTWESPIYTWIYSLSWVSLIFLGALIFGSIIPFWVATIIVVPAFWATKEYVKKANISPIKEFAKEGMREEAILDHPLYKILDRNTNIYKWAIKIVLGFLLFLGLISLTTGLTNWDKSNFSQSEVSNSQISELLSRIENDVSSAISELYSLQILLLDQHSREFEIIESRIDSLEENYESLLDEFDEFTEKIDLEDPNEPLHNQ